MVAHAEADTAVYAKLTGDTAWCILHNYAMKVEGVKALRKAIVLTVHRYEELVHGKHITVEPKRKRKGKAKVSATARKISKLRDQLEAIEFEMKSLENLS